MATLGNTGRMPMDPMLRSELVGAGVSEKTATELARGDAFGGKPAVAWVEGLRITATLLNRGATKGDLGTLPEPWGTIAPALRSVNGIAPEEKFLDCLAVYPAPVQNALLEAVARVASEMPPKGSEHLSVPASPAQTQHMQPVDPDLMLRIQTVLGRKSGDKSRNLKEAGELLIDWLWMNGAFVRTSYGERFYLYRKTHRLYRLDTEAWQIFLQLCTGVNSALRNFNALEQDCKVTSEEGELKEVVRVAHWDERAQMLRVSRFDGLVYRLDGQTIETEGNGDGPALFEDQPGWASFEPDYGTAGKVADWVFSEVPSWDKAPEEHDKFSLLFRVWVLATFFSELCPTRPILAMKGEKGSGKTMALRIVLQMIFGRDANVSGVPEKMDDFAASVSNSHILVLDNLDDPIKELRDRIGRLATGAVDTRRRLYTNNETARIAYRCWLAITARTPDTLRRDDLVDRVIILPTKRIEDSSRRREGKFLRQAERDRGRWWGDLLQMLNTVVAEIRRTDLGEYSVLRMADWGAFGSIVAKALNEETLWQGAIKEVKERQAEFLLEDNPLVVGVDAWLESLQYSTEAQRTRDLYMQISSVLFGAGHPDPDWPRSAKVFGRWLKDISRELEDYLKNREKRQVLMSTYPSEGYTKYQFIKVKLSDWY